MPGELFREVYGTYVPRLCVDTVVIGPDDRIEFTSMTKQGVPVFTFSATHGVALKRRTEEPRKGQYGLPGGTMFKGERPAAAAARIIKAELGVDIEIVSEDIGHMHFPNEHRVMDGVEFTIDSFSVVVLARAVRLRGLGPDVAWYREAPPIVHDYHTPFLRARGLLPS